MKAWLKKTLGIDKLETENENLRLEIQQHAAYVNQKVAELKEYTRVDADVGYRGKNTIILTGVYRNRGYVKFYDLGIGDFEHLARQLMEMKKHSLIRNIDAPPSFHGVFDLGKRV